MITNFARRVNARLMALTQSTDLINKRGIDAWRERIYSFILRGLVVFGFLAALPSIWISIQVGLYGLAIFDALAYLLVLCLIPLRNIEYRLRAMLLLFIGYSIGVVVFLATGEQGAGMFWLFAMPPLASLLLGLAWGLFFIGLNVFFVIGTSLLLVGDLPGLPELANFTLSGWLVVAVNFLVTNLIVTVPLGALLRGLVQGAEEVRNVQVLNDVVLATSPAGILVYEAESGQCVLANAAASEIVGATEAQLLAQRFREIASWEPAGLAVKAELAIATGTVQQLDTEFVTTFGKPAFMHCQFDTFELRGAQHLLLVMSEISEINEARKAIEKRVEELEAIRQVSEKMRVADNVEEMLPSLLDTALETLDSELGSIWLYDPATDLLSVRVSRGYGPPGEDPFPIPPEKPGQGLAGMVFASNQSNVTQKFRNEERIPEEIRRLIPEGLGGISVPIRANQDPIGVFVVNTQAPRQPSESDANLLTTIAEIAGSAIRRAQLHQETKRSLRRLIALAEVNRAITANLDLHLTLETLVRQVVEQLEVDAADVLLLNEHLHALEFAAGWGFSLPGFGKGLTLGHGKGFGGRVLAKRKLVLLRNLPPDDMHEEFAKDIRLEGFKTYVGVPLFAKGQLKGVMGIFHRSDLDPDMEWLSFLQSLAAQASIAIDNANLVQNLQRSNLDLQLAYDATIEGWSRAMDLRDHETEGHSQRVTELAIRLARRVGIKDDQLVHLRRGALLHDIGKMGIPDEILHKPGPLTDAEWLGMRRHPEYAHAMLEEIEYLKSALDIPYAHHEKWDGSGYPQGLKGESIPLAARIFAVVDVYDALTSDRPYRKAWSRQQALDYIRHERGKHFEPAVADAFLAMIEGE